MKWISISLSSLIVFCCLAVFANSSTAQWKHPPGAKIEAKHKPDLPRGQSHRARPQALDINKIKEFDRVTGVCLQPDGNPAAEATVHLYRKTPEAHGKEGHELVGSTKTEKDGKFDFKNLQARFKTNKFNRYFILVVQKKGFATKFANSLVWEKDQQEIKLSRRAMIKGVIKGRFRETRVRCCGFDVSPTQGNTP